MCKTWDRFDFSSQMEEGGLLVRFLTHSPQFTMVRVILRHHLTSCTPLISFCLPPLRTPYLKDVLLSTQKTKFGSLLISFPEPLTLRFAQNLYSLSH